MNFLPSVVRAEYRGAYRIHVVFNDGSENTIDFQAWLEGPIFEPLKDRRYFQRFLLDGGAHYTELLTPPSFVPETMKALDLLKSFLRHPQ